MSSEKYLTMQKDYYNVEASHGSLENKNPVVGWYHEHTVFADYDNYLFKDFDTTGKVALEYGCGPGRNLIRYASRFDRVDGVDISVTSHNGGSGTACVSCIVPAGSTYSISNGAWPIGAWFELR